MSYYYIYIFVKLLIALFSTEISNPAAFNFFLSKLPIMDFRILAKQGEIQEQQRSC